MHEIKWRLLKALSESKAYLVVFRSISAEAGRSDFSVQVCSVSSSLSAAVRLSDPEGEAAGCSAQVDTSWDCSRVPTGSEVRGERREMGESDATNETMKCPLPPSSSLWWRWRRVGQRGTGRKGIHRNWCYRESGSGNYPSMYIGLLQGEVWRGGSRVCINCCCR